jgi:transcriptional regulator with GAF, ATPase, and Fis domain
VLDQKRPVIVSDALTDTTFGKSESVIALKLSSVMCVPLLSQGETVGALYVANDEVKHLFERRQLDLLTIFASQASLILQNAMLLSALRADKEKLKGELVDKRFGEIIGACASMTEVFRKLAKVAATDISVLVTGETGTGKELIAREIHRRSTRVNGPFVTVNCGAIPENLMESEMFGHVRGAFTDARESRSGRFELADGGTLFLDEVGNLPLAQQAKLLRVLESGRFERVGGSRTLTADVRVLTATNADLPAMIGAGRFRRDLYFRLNTVEIHIPPLRERRADIPVLAQHFLDLQCRRQGRDTAFSDAALAALQAHGWPGNVRELAHAVERAVLLARGARIEPRDLALAPDADTEAPGGVGLMPLADAERVLIRNALDRFRGNVQEAASALGLSRSAMYRRLEKLGMSLEEE